jgi:NADH-quinone oxidoreductase subunit J
MSSPGTVVFYAVAALVIACAALVAFSRNMLHSALALLGTLGGVAGLYLHLGADFLGITQLLIYVGGILVLVLFAVLLTTQIGDVRASNTSLGRALALPVAGAAGVGLVVLVTWVRWPETEAVAAPTTARLGDAFLREYLLPFELVSVVLLMALVGAMVIARRAAKEQPVTPEEVRGLERRE